MKPSVTRLPPAARLPRSALAAVAAVAIAIAMGLAVELGPTLTVPAHVAGLRIANPTVYQVNVEVTDARDGRWLDLGAIGPERSKTVEEVTDQGRRWVFRFSYGGVDAGRIDAARSELEGAGWMLTVPREVGERLRTAGLAPSAS